LSTITAIGLFVSLPLVYSFIFGVIFNKPNFVSVLRHYGFLVYILVALGVYLMILKPDSIILGFRYFFHFILGLVISVVGYFSYAITYRLSRRFKKYRWRALLSFLVSFIIMFVLVFVLSHYKIFELI